MSLLEYTARVSTKYNEILWLADGLVEYVQICQLVTLFFKKPGFIADKIVEY